MKFLESIDYVVSERKMYENNGDGDIHVYSPGTGADNPPLGFVFIYSILQSI